VTAANGTTLGGETDGLTPRLTGFVAALRERGLAVGPAETVDAAGALGVLGLADREQLRHGLAATLVRRDGYRSVFDAVFDLYFPAAVGTSESSRAELEQLPELGEHATTSELRQQQAELLDRLREQLAQALAAGDAAALARLAQAAVEAFGRVQVGPPGRGGSGGTGANGLGGSGSSGYQGWSALRTLEQLRPQTLIAGVQEQVEAASDDPDGFTARLGRDEIRRRVEHFRRLVEGEARRRSAEVRRPADVAQHAGTAIEDVDFLMANRAQLAELRRIVQPMSRRLAGRLSARRRRHRRGEIDLRRTFRRSLSTGGIPMRPAYRRPRPGRPDLVLLCDVSGSVSGFAQFTLMLVEALHEQFSRVRSFAFVDSVDEITELVADNAGDPTAVPGGLLSRIMTEARVSRWSGHSDYAGALRQFADEYADAVGPRTSVLILGDARTNGGSPNLPALGRVLGPAKHAYWLNPEPRRSWGTGDSVAPAYRELVEMFECRNAHQLAQVITQLLPI
jgi:uncharacterized protein with von Willebrand factor type A (vWA) domain